MKNGLLVSLACCVVFGCSSDDTDKKESSAKAETEAAKKPGSTACNESKDGKTTPQTRGQKFIHFGKTPLAILRVPPQQGLVARYALIDLTQKTKPVFLPETEGEANLDASGTRIVVWEKKSARIWNAKTGKAVTPVLNTDEVILRASFSPDGSALATTGADARIWDARTGKQIGESLKHDGKSAFDAVFSPDGSTLLTTTAKGAYLWEVKTAKLRFHMPHAQKKDNAIGYACFSSDGALFVTCHLDNTARVWDVKTGKPKYPPLQHDGHVRFAAFNSKGDQLVTVFGGKKARVWDAKAGKPISPTMTHPTTDEYAECSAPCSLRRDNS